MFNVAGAIGVVDVDASLMAGDGVGICGDNDWFLFIMLSHMLIFVLCVVGSGLSYQVDGCYDSVADRCCALIIACCWLLIADYWSLVADRLLMIADRWLLLFIIINTMCDAFVDCMKMMKIQICWCSMWWHNVDYDLGKVALLYFKKIFCKKTHKI